VVYKEKSISYLIIAVSILVPVVVALLFFVSPPEIQHNLDLSFFPKFHALLNSGTAVCIAVGVVLIKNKNVKFHRAAMLSAFLLSTIFLVSYVTYHGLSDGSTRYGDVDGDGALSAVEAVAAGLWRYVYLFILLTHIVLAALILPLILFTFEKALSGKIEQHRKLAKWTFPLWMYVAITGVLVYWMISPFYTH
jgi:putative membrane protein